MKRTNFYYGLERTAKSIPDNCNKCLHKENCKQQKDCPIYIKNTRKVNYRHPKGWHLSCRYFVIKLLLTAAAPYIPLFHPASSGTCQPASLCSGRNIPLRHLRSCR